MKTINIFGVNIQNVTQEEVLDIICEAIRKNEQRKIYFVNADCLNKAWVDHDYREVLKQNPYIFGDGSGVLLGSKILGDQIVANVNGTDLFPEICKMCLKNEYSLFMLGSHLNVVTSARNKLKLHYGENLKINGVHDGYFDFECESDQIIDEINRKNVDILFVGFGAPAQEKWIHRFSNRLKCKVIIGVGGLFDFVSESVPRAPSWIRKIGFEWFYRLYQEPRRLWKRYLIGNPLFILRICKWKFLNS